MRYIKQTNKQMTAVKLRYWNGAVYLLQTKQIRVKKIKNKRNKDLV